MGKIQENDARLQQLVSMARIGWWEVDFDEGVYYCSEFVADLLGIEGNKISAKDFANLICENYRERILEEFRSFRMMEIYEQVFRCSSNMWDGMGQCTQDPVKKSVMCQRKVMSASWVCCNVFPGNG